MDLSIGSEVDLQKLAHCEILKAEASVLNGTACIGLVLRNLDEVLFQVFFVPGIDTSMVAGKTHIKPSLTIVTKEVVQNGDPN